MNDISPAAVGYMTPEREMLRRIARDFTDKEVLPVANELDPKKETIPQSLIDQMGELGFFGIVIPEEYGGAGGEERLKRIRLMAEGKYLGALAMSEPEVGSDISSITCRARVEDDHWVITGNKYWCTFADGANFIQVIARTEGDPAKRHAALTGIGIEKPPGELPEGVTGSPIPKIGYHGWKTWELHFENVRVPITKQQRESKGQAFYGMTRGLQTARAHTAARSIGLAQGALEQAIAYSKERIQFRRPIADFQAIRFKIANMAAEVEAARQLNYARRAADEDLRGDVGDHAEDRVRRAAWEAVEEELGMSGLRRLGAPASGRCREFGEWRKHDETCQSPLEPFRPPGFGRHPGGSPHSGRAVCARLVRLRARRQPGAALGDPAR